jgi:hypothetical protein
MFPGVEVRFLGKARLKAMADRRHEVEMDVDHFLESVSRSKGSFLQEEGDLFQSMEVHRGVTNQVHVGCNNIDKLLTELQEDMSAQAKKGEVVETSEQHQQKARRLRSNGEAVDDPHEVKQLRAFAAEDTTMEGSMSNYSVEPAGVPTQSTMEDEIREIRLSLGKIRDSACKLRDILEDNVQWWSSTITLRRIKTHALRCNFHARRVRLWGNYSRQTVLINATSLNKLASDASSEIREHQHNLHQLQTRREVASRKLVQYESEAAQLSKLLMSALEEKSVMDQKILESGRASLRIACNKNDVTRIESIFLVDKLSVLKEFAEDAEVVKAWLYHQNSFPS